MKECVEESGKGKNVNIGKVDPDSRDIITIVILLYKGYGFSVSLQIIHQKVWEKTIV